MTRPSLSLSRPYQTHWVLFDVSAHMDFDFIDHPLARIVPVILFMWFGSNVGADHLLNVRPAMFLPGCRVVGQGRIGFVLEPLELFGRQRRLDWLRLRLWLDGGLLFLGAISRS